MTVSAVQRGAPRAWKGGCHGGQREREGEEIAMNVNVRGGDSDVVGGVIFIVSNGTPT